ncbi:MAG: efflux RND transporter permease subunit [bacterium]|nr:efflux RND transporter permease subunit [bacterium]
MFERIIDLVFRNRLLVIVFFTLCIGLGVWRMLHTAVDAFPDTTPVQVQINAVASALNPAEIEQQITLPLELAIAGLPGLVDVRSTSKFGFAQVVATFDDTTHIYDARQLLMERIGSVTLPAGIERPTLGPIATGLGEVFHYTLSSTSPNRTLDELRTLHDWVVKPELRKVAGVAEINSWGGFERQYHVIVNPESLVKYDLSIGQVFTALEQNNQNVGGGQVVRSGESLLVHGVGRVSTLDEIGDIVLKASAGIPVRVRDVAEVSLGHAIRRGAVTAEGQGEVVLGLGFMLMGENSKEVTKNLRLRLESVRASLPDDVVLTTVYDRSELVRAVLDTVTHNLVAGAVLVIAVLFVMLGRLRAGLIVASAIPLAMVFAVLGMYELAIAASLLSLGAIDFGIIVDGSVVMTENNMRSLAEQQRLLGRPLRTSERLESIVESSKEVLRPIVFGMGIILVVFFPILTLQGIEGKMFRPMALTFIFAMVGALLVAITLSPVLSFYFLPRNFRDNEGRGSRVLQRAYGAVLSITLRRHRWLYGLLAALLAITAVTASRLGGEFVPKLTEGSIVINTIRLAGVSIDEAAAYNTRIEQLLLDEFPDEIRHIWSRIGTAEVATDPMGIELTDIFIALNPRHEWKRARSHADLVQAMQEELDDLPAVNMVFTQPIEMRLNEMVSGIRSDVGIKIVGDDFDQLRRLSDRVQEILLTIEGAADVAGEQITGQPTLEIHLKQDQLGRHGIPGREVLDFIEAVGVRPVGEIIEGQRRFPLVVRLPDELRSDVDALADTAIPTSAGVLLPLRSLAQVEETEGPATINREWGRRLIKVQCNVRGRDVASFVDEARIRMDRDLILPEGYVIEWGGQFEHLQRSKLRFAVVVPITLALVFLLLYLSLKNLRDVLIIYTAIPFAVIGGVFALWIRDMPFSVSAAIGFIALSGIAVLNGQVLVSAIRTVQNRGMPLLEAVPTAAKQRLRPVLATAITDAVGFFPMAISMGVGAEVQRPLATVVIGGVFTTTLLTLLVLPAIYSRFAK